MWWIARIMRVLGLLAVAVVLIGSTGLLRAAGAPMVLDVRAGIHGETTRLVFDMSEPVSFKVFSLIDPYRVVVDLPEVGWNLPARPLPANTGYLQKLRYGLFKPGNSRVVLDVSGPVVVGKAFFIPPGGESKTHRLVLDMVSTSRDSIVAMASREADSDLGQVPAGLAAGPAAPRSQAAALAFPAPPHKPREPKAKKVIVIDPGHGGVDPGALGTSGTYEKDVTLKVAFAMRDALEKAGRYKVILTRDRDIFLQLRERVAIARDAGADLFVSIHADTLKNARIRGLSVYTLSEKASDSEAALLAERENKADVIAGIDLSKESSEVSNILIDLAQREAMNQSARFAGALIKGLSPSTPLLPNTHRFAGFAVLKAPDVPSVLIELGFLSNKQDELALTQARHREKLAASMVGAVDAYFARLEEAHNR